MAKIHILSLLLFWREEKISDFWVDLCERLKQKDQAIKIHNLEEKRKLIGIQTDPNDPHGWVEKIQNPVGDFINCLRDYNDINRPDTMSVFQLLTAFRNFVSHKFGIEIPRYKNTIKANKNETEAEKYARENLERERRKLKRDQKTELEKKKVEVDEELKDGRVKYWLENFPEFSLITWKAGLDVSWTQTANMSEFKDTYFPHIDRNTLPKSSNPQFIKSPMNLFVYSDKLSEWIDQEITARTGLWKHSFTTENDQITVTFLAIPEAAAIDLVNRELLTLDWMPTQPQQSYNLQISRKVISTSDEISCLLNKSTLTARTSQNAANTINLELNAETVTENDKSFPFIAFSDVLACAIEACLKSESKAEQCVIFTNQSSDCIMNVVQTFCKRHYIMYNNNTISWDHLSMAYRKELVTEYIPLHETSKVELCLSDIYSPSRIVNAINEIVDLDISGCPEINIVLPELMHKPQLLYSCTDQLGQLIPRTLSLRFDGTIDPMSEVSLSSYISLQKISTLKSLFIVYGNAGIGKSTFLAKLGHTFCHTELVLFTTCSRIMSLVEPNQVDFVEILWHDSNNFQKKVVRYILESQKCPLTICIDSFHELTVEERGGFFQNFFIPFLRGYRSNKTITIFLAGRSYNKFHGILSNRNIERQTGCKCKYLELLDISSTVSQTYMTRFFRSINTGLTNDPHVVDTLVKDCITFINNELGYLARTPFAYQIIMSICDDLELSNQGSVIRKKLGWPYIYEKFQNMFLREKIAKMLQNHEIPIESKVDSKTINIHSSVFRLFKETVEKHYGRESYKLKFPELELPETDLGLVGSKKFVSDAVLDLVSLSGTLIPDYNCSLLMFTTKNFITGTVFDFHQKTYYPKHLHILTFLDTQLKAQKEKERPSFKLDLQTNKIHEILFMLVFRKLYYVFFEVIETKPSNIDIKSRVWSTNRECIQDFLNVVMIEAIKNRYFSAVKFLVEIVAFDLKTFKLAQVRDDILKDLNSTVDENIFKYLEEKSALNHKN